MLVKKHQSHGYRFFKIAWSNFLNSIFSMVIIAFVQFQLMHSYNKSQIAIRSQFQQDMTLIQWETMKKRKVEEEESRPANWMWNCSLKSLPEASGLITAPWQAKRNIANQIHKKVGHLPSWQISASFVPFSL